MYVHSVKLVNYKSFGDCPENEIILEPGVTAIIGKNESGKSNVLEGLSQILFTKRNEPAFQAKCINRNTPAGTTIKYIAVLKPTSEDIQKGIVEDTEIVISPDGFVADGALVSYYSQHVLPDVKHVIEILGGAKSNPFRMRDQDYRFYQTSCKELEAEEMDIPYRDFAFRFILKNAKSISEEKREPLLAAIDCAFTKWEELINLLPVFFYRRGDKRLNSSYTIEEIRNELRKPSSAPNSLLSDFIKLIGISTEDFILAAQSGASGQQETIRRRINRAIDEKVNKPFNDFYQTEKIALDLGFGSGTVPFVIQSNEGAALMLDERSNGLRWYLECFIDAQANNVAKKNVVYLIDEPGTSLHVNAQRELLTLFRHLAEQGNQVVYTTHSPYMLDSENDGIHRIRAVVKDSEGYSRVYKTAYDSRIAPESQQDTLAPIISALGMNLQDTFGPAKDKINIVTEGASDYIYLCTMARILGIDTSRYTIIPSVGAPNCVNVCLILHGWGCRYIALFDYDKEGVESGGEILRKGLIFECGKQYCYVCDVTEDDIKAKKYTEIPIMIEDVMGRDEISRFIRESGYTEGELGKTLTAKLMCTAIENGQFILSEDSKNNFKTLFDRILSCCAE